MGDFPKQKCLSLCSWVCENPFLVLGSWNPYGCTKKIDPLN